MFTHVKKRVIPLRWDVNKHGFCSMYVLLLLPIFVSFCILLLMRTTAHLALLDQQKHTVQLLAIYATKAWLEKPMDEQESDEEVSEQTIQVDYNTITLQISFYDTYNDIQVTMPEQTYSLRIEYTSDTKEIVDIVY